MDFIQRGLPILGKIPLIPVHEYLFPVMQKHGDRTYMTNATTGKSYTCNDILTSCKRLALGLQAIGCRKGDIISLYGFNSAEYIIVVLGSMSIGMTVNTINPAATAYELRHYLNEVGPDFVYTETQLLENVRMSLKETTTKPVVLLRQASDDYVNFESLCSKANDNTNRESPIYDVENDVACIAFSSGTSGLPKGVLLTHYALVSYFYSKGDVIQTPTEGQGCVLTAFPLYPSASLVSVLGLILAGVEFIVLENYNLELFIQSIERYKPDVLVVASSIMVQFTKSPLLKKYDVSSVKMAFTAAAPLKGELEDAFNKCLSMPFINQSYGMTECVAGATKSEHDPSGPIRRGTTGKPATGCELKVVSVDSGEALGPNKPGEIYIRCPHVMKGYLNRPEQTAETLDKDGWLHTGDIGYYDDGGYFFIVDRIKELIKYKGNQVAPAELEAAILDHADVTDVGVVGIPDPDAGEVPRAYVVRRENSGLTEQQVEQHVKERLSYYKWLRGGVVFLSEIPRLASGKILRRKLRELNNQTSKL